MAKSINIYKSISDYKDGYDDRKNISLSLIIDDEEEEIVDSHVKSGFITFTAEEAGSTIGLAKLSTYQLLEYTTDQVVNPSAMCYPVWKKMDVDTIITLVNAGDMVHFRGILSGDNYSSNYTQFKMTGKISSSGNCNSLWNCNDLNAPLKEYCGNNMFSGCTSLTTAPELPATTLAERCYYYMFSGCTSLTTAPELPATTLAGSCYNGMFQSCTSLTQAPDLPATTLVGGCYRGMFEYCISLTTVPSILPATTLASWCYSNMFSYCTILTTAPNLPATTLTSHCYYYMFSGCTSLTTVPDLPATTLADSCYNGMFYGCSNLNYLKCLATDITATKCTYNWVSGVSSTGTFIKESGVEWTTGNSGIPSGWIVEEV